MSVDHDEERALLERIRLRDVQAFELLYRRYHRRLNRFLFNMTRRPTLVEEVLDDTMMVVWNRPEAFNDSSKLSSWIYAIAYRQALQALRRQDVPVDASQVADRADEGSAVDAATAHGHTRRALQAAMAQLSVDHRIVVDLTYYHDLGYREIADIMNCPVDTVKTRMFHARRHLARLLPGVASDWL